MRDSPFLCFFAFSQSSSYIQPKARTEATVATSSCFRISWRPLRCHTWHCATGTLVILGRIFAVHIVKGMRSSTMDILATHILATLGGEWSIFT
ncbi:hypothetical protein B0H12DRAFT_1137691 [Mycena haematopus]|nr:hypothetical protein B0H12DRAFT_1137691 [Mycena haematopus]